MSILQGYRGFTVFSPTAGSPIPVFCRAGGAIDQPRNLDIPYPIVGGAYGGVQNFADGLLTASAQFALMPMKTVSGTTSYGWWTTAQLQAWLQTYTNDDLAVIGGGGIDFADAVDSAGSFNIVAPKAMSYRVSGSFGEPVGFYTRWAGTAANSGLAGSVPAAGAITGGPLQFDSISFGGALAGLGITAFTLDVDLGTSPNPTLNGTLHPTEMNAGMVSGRLSYSLNGTGAAAIADGAGTSYIEIGGVTFNMQSLVTTNPTNRNQGTTRRIRTFEAVVFSSPTARAVTIS